MPIPIVFILGNRVDAVWADVDRDVTPSRSVVAAVDQEAEIGVEVRPDDRKLDVDHDEAPGEISPEPDVKRECVPPVGWYGCTVGCEKFVADALPAPWGEHPRNYADVGTGVNQESQFADSISDE